MAAARILCGGTTLNPRRQSATFPTNKPYSTPKFLYSTTSIHPQPPKIIRAFSVGARRGRDDDDNKFLPKRSIDAIDISGRRVKSYQPQKSLQALVANTNARLQVYDDDGISYKKLFSFKIQSLLEKAKMAAIFLIKVSFILPFGASNVAGYAVAFIEVILLFIISQNLESIAMKNLKSGYLYRAEFIDCIFSYVFGDGDPNQGIEEKRWKMIELYIALNGCVVTAEEIAPYLLDPETKKMNDESYMLPVLHRFNGQPKVDENGYILYHFPSLLCTSLPTRTSREKEYVGRYVDRGIKVDKFLDEQQWEFSKLDDKALDFVAGILRYNLFCVALLGVYLWGLEPRLFSYRCLFIPMLFPIYAIFAVSFNVISSTRWFWIQNRNAEIFKRNEAREELVKSLESPDLFLMQKLVSARAMAQKVFIENDRMVSSKFTDHRPDSDELSCTETETETSNENRNKKWKQWAARKLQF